MRDLKRYIAARVAQELRDGDVVNLGIGLPTLVADYIPEGIDVLFQSENGFVGLGPVPEGEEDPYIVNAGAFPAGIQENGAFFDSATSFLIIRGGHVDLTILGALEVDEKGNLANWIIPGKMVPGMGGAMDLVVGAKRVLIAMEHTNKGRHKILSRCQLPLTGVGVVDRIITEMAVIDVTEQGLVLVEKNPAFSVEEILAATGAKLAVSSSLKAMPAWPEE